jgi:hypothetical protein
MTNLIPTPIRNQQPATNNQPPTTYRATEDPAAYQLHSRQFFDEYQPATPTETQLTQELADTAWRLNRPPPRNSIRAPPRARTRTQRAAALLELHKRKGIPYDPTQDGFVFSKDEIEAHTQRLMRLNESRHIEYVLFQMQPPTQRGASRAHIGA